MITFCESASDPIQTQLHNVVPGIINALNAGIMNRLDTIESSSRGMHMSILDGLNQSKSDTKLKFQEQNLLIMDANTRILQDLKKFKATTTTVMSVIEKLHL